MTNTDPLADRAAAQPAGHQPSTAVLDSACHSDTDDEPSSAGELIHGEWARAFLLIMSLAGTRQVQIDAKPLRIGGSLESDLVVPSSEELGEVVVHRAGGLVVMRTTRGDSAARVNGIERSWSVLDDGDELEFGGLHMRIEIEHGSEPAGGESVALLPRVTAALPDPIPLDPDDRRKSTRVSLMVPGQVTLFGAAQDRQAVTVFDLSEGGVLLYSSAVLPEHERVSLAFSLPPDDTEVNLELEVLSSRSRGADGFASRCRLVDAPARVTWQLMRTCALLAAASPGGLQRTRVDGSSADADAAQHEPITVANECVSAPSALARGREAVDGPECHRCHARELELLHLVREQDLLTSWWQCRGCSRVYHAAQSTEVLLSRLAVAQMTEVTTERWFEEVPGAG